MGELLQQSFRPVVSARDYLEGNRIDCFEGVRTFYSVRVHYEPCYHDEDANHFSNYVDYVDYIYQLDYNSNRNAGPRSECWCHRRWRGRRVSRTGHTIRPGVGCMATVRQAKDS